MARRRSTVGMAAVMLLGCPADKDSEPSGDATGSSSATETTSSSTTSGSSNSGTSTTAPGTSSTSSEPGSSGGAGTTTDSGAGTTGGLIPIWACSPFVTDVPFMSCTEDTTCVLVDRQQTDQLHDSGCLDTNASAALVGESCQMPDGPLALAHICEYGSICAGETITSTEGLCIRLCDSMYPCPTGTCVRCSTGVEYNYQDPIGVCLEEAGCPGSSPGCAVAGCWPEG